MCGGDATQSQRKHRPALGIALAGFEQLALGGLIEVGEDLCEGPIHLQH